MQARPQRRSHGVVFERLDDGAVIYDGVTKQAHSLDRAATRVFAAADGTRSAGDIAAEAELDESCVHAVLDQLGARGLLIAAPGVSRRGMLKRAGMVGAAAVAAAPLIDTVIIPTAAAHASTMPTGSGGGGGGAPTAYTIQLSGVMAQTLHWSFTSGSGANSSGDNLTLRSGLNWDSSGNATATDYVGSDIFQVTYFENNGEYIITGELLASLNSPFTAVFTDITNPYYSASWSGSDQVGTYVFVRGGTLANYPGVPAFHAPAGDQITLTFTFSA